jgi:DNA-binding transcriptional ArsR family regulator
MKRATQKVSRSGIAKLGESPNIDLQTQMPEMELGADDGKSVAILAKGLSDENRLRILMCLSGRKKSVSSIVEEVGLSQPLVSHHLKELKRCLLVTVERSGPFIYYEVADSKILGVVQALASIAAGLVAARTTL